jgi:hypothetical protein
MTNILNISDSATFKKVKVLESEIEKLLEERPQYREWFMSVKKEIDDKATSKHNRCAIAIDIMLQKWQEILKANDDLKYANLKLKDEVDVNKE